MKIEVATTEDYDSFAFESLDDTGWDLIYSNSLTKVWTKESKNSNLNTVRVSSIFEGIKPEKLIDEIYSEKNAKDLEGTVEESTVLETLDENNTVSYFRLASPVPFVSSRDFVTRRSIRRSPTECIVMLKSVTHKSKPVDSSCVRGDTQINGYYCIPHEKGSNLIYLTRSDLGGYIPSWAINYITTKLAPKLMEDLRKVIKKNEEK